MFEFYRRIKESDPKRQNIALTVLDGPCFGKKLLAENRKIVWQSGQGDTLMLPEDQFDIIDGSGIYWMGGCQMYCEILGQEIQLAICGAGHVSIPLIQMGRMLGFPVTVLEDRPQFAEHARHAGADQVICEPFEQGLEKLLGDKDTFFVIVTRGHQCDQLCLEHISRKEHAYIGMIGSRKKSAKIKETLRQRGCDPAVIDSVHSPIGLPIGAKTPEEIAVAILAEIIQVKSQRKRDGGYSREILDEVLAREGSGEKMAMATIVSRRGSAPREVAAKMLIPQEGSCVGTIGGGFVESKTAQTARQMLGEGREKYKLCHFDMSDRDAGQEGMVCGGQVDILIETIES